MKPPKMILFDYGQTLICEPSFDGIRGNEALLRHAVKNKNNLNAADLKGFADELFRRTNEVRRLGYETHSRAFNKFLYGYLELEFSLSPLETETVFWEAAAPGTPMPGIDRFLEYINSYGIRSGVISNISFSGEALAERINRLLPENRFEFIIASSEFLLRKPDKMLFEIALKKAGLTSEDVWFCGDNIKADIEGAALAGIFPVWYENLTMENPWKEWPEGLQPCCSHLHIHDWGELINTMEEIRSDPDSGVKND